MHYLEPTSRQKTTGKLLDKMLELAGHSIYYDEYVKLSDKYKSDYTISQADLNVWSNWAVRFLQKELNYNLKQAEEEVSWIQHYHGLKQL